MEYQIYHQLYDILIYLEAFIFFSYAVFFIINYLKSSEFALANSSLNPIHPDKLDLKKLLATLFISCSLFTLVIAPSWWSENSILSLSLIFLFGCLFIHDSFLLAIFILLLLLRPWELIEARNQLQFSMDLRTILDQTSQIISLPKLCFFLLIGISILAKLNKSHTYGLKWGLSDTSVAFFLIWMLLPTLMSGQSEALNTYFETLFRSGIIYFAIRWNFKSKFYYSLLKSTFIYVGFFLLISSLLNYLFITSDQQEVGIRVQAFGLFKNSNDLAALIVFSCPFILTQASHFIFQLFITGTSFLAIYATQSRGAFLGLLVALVTYFSNSSKFQKIILTRKNMAFGAFIIVSFFLIYSSKLERSHSDIEASTSSRINYWVAALRMTIANPIWGIGFGNYEVNFEKYALEIIETGNRTAHSSFFLVLAEGGIIGILVYLLIFYTGILNACKIRKKNPELLASLLGYGTTMLFLSHSYLIFIYLLLATIKCLHDEELKNSLNQ